VLCALGVFKVATTDRIQRPVSPHLTLRHTRRSHLRGKARRVRREPGPYQHGHRHAAEARAEAGVLRSDVDPLDVGFSLGGILLITTDKGLRDRAGRMLDLLLDGLRHRAV
jgi:hypothetical protein